MLPPNCFQISKILFEDQEKRSHYLDLMSHSQTWVMSRVNGELHRCSDAGHPQFWCSGRFTGDSNHPGSSLPGVELLPSSVSFFCKVTAKLELTWSILNKTNYFRNHHGKLKGRGWALVFTAFERLPSGGCFAIVVRWGQRGREGRDHIKYKEKPSGFSAMRTASELRNEEQSF